jgi:hypothetical protein
MARKLDGLVHEFSLKTRDLRNFKAGEKLSLSAAWASDPGVARGND